MTRGEAQEARDRLSAGGRWQYVALTVSFCALIFAGPAVAGEGAKDEILSPGFITATMRRVADWQLAHLGEPVERADGSRQKVSGTSWIRGTFLAGVMAAARASGDRRYLTAATELGEENRWRPGPRRRHADDLCIAQTYAELFLLEKDERMIAPTVEHLDALVDEAQRGEESRRSRKARWTWSDALFMAAPTLALVARATGDRRYLELMHRRWWQAHAQLYDRDANLWFRDRRYVAGRDGTGPQTKNGHKVFWSRGNGWVLAGLARVLEHLPTEAPERPRYEQLLREMAASLSAVQGSDGLWRSSLLDLEEFPGPESSGTALITFGLAWGINHGVLDEEKYWPAVRRGWGGLTSALEPPGRLGWVQRVGAEPGAANAGDSTEFGAGAFLLAAAEILDLVTAARGHERRSSVAMEQPR